MRDPEADRILANVVPRADRARGRELACARRAYAWALEHVEHGDDLLGAVMPMIVSRAGDRGRVGLGLLQQVTETLGARL